MRRMGKVAFLFFIFISFIANAESRVGKWNVGGAVGATVDPDLLSFQLGVDYYITEDIAVGPLIQYGVNGNDWIWGTSGQVKYCARLKDTEQVRPYGQAGIGFVEYIHDDFYGGERTTKYLFPVGGGFEFKLAKDLTLDTNILFDISEKLFVGIWVGARYLI